MLAAGGGGYGGGGGGLARGGGGGGGGGGVRGVAAGGGGILSPTTRKTRITSKQIDRRMNMRKGAKVKFNKDMEGNFSFSCDWKENPSDVMEAVDKELAQHGLEVVSHESDGDFYAFSIMKIKE